MADQENKEELVAEIGLQVNQNKLKTANKALDDFVTKLTDIKSAALILTPILAEVFAAKQAEAVTRMSATAEQIGLTVSQFRALGLAAKNAGLDVGAVTGVIGNLNQELLGYQTGNAPQQLLTSLAKANSLLGTRIDPITNTGKIKTAYQLFTEIATAIGRIHDKQKQAAASVSLFGTNLVPLLKNGMQGINEAFAQLNDRGLFLKGDEINQMKAFNSQINLMKEELSSTGQRLAIALIPVLTQFNKLLTDKETVKTFTDGLILLAKATLLLAQGLALVLGPLEKIMHLVGRGWGQLGTLIGNGVANVTMPSAVQLTPDDQARAAAAGLIPNPNGVQLTPQAQAELAKLNASKNTNVSNSNSSSSSSNIVNNNVTHVNINSRKSMLSIPSYAGAVP